MGTSDSCIDANQRYDEFASFRVLKLRRVNIMRNMVEIFKDESVMACAIKVMINSAGKQELGVDNLLFDLSSMICVMWEKKNECP